MALFILSPRRFIVRTPDQKLILRVFRGINDDSERKRTDENDSKKMLFTFWRVQRESCNQVNLTSSVKTKHTKTSGLYRSGGI